MGTMIVRVHEELTDEDHTDLSCMERRKEGGIYEDIAGDCKAVCQKNLLAFDTIPITGAEQERVTI
jgi:hypothetical protein